MGYNPHIYFTREATANNGSPADSTTYYFGNANGLFVSSVRNQGKMYFLESGIIEKAVVTWRSDTQDPTTEDTTISLRKNDTSDTVIYTGSLANANSPKTATLNVNYSSGDYFQIKFIAPAWVTNPTGLYIVVTLFCRPS